MKGDTLREDLIASLPRLRRYAYALTGDRSAADDLAQATVERALSKPAPEDANVTAWLLRICKNLWIDDLRARRVRGVRVDPEAVDLEHATDGARATEARLELAKVNAAMARLPEDQRAALSLVALEGCSYQEAADILETPIGTVMSRIARARRALADLLAAPTVVSLRTNA